MNNELTINGNEIDYTSKINKVNLSPKLKRLGNKTFIACQIPEGVVSVGKHCFSAEIEKLVLP